LEAAAFLCNNRIIVLLKMFKRLRSYRLGSRL
jgi:hypothetical protein